MNRRDLIKYGVSTATTIFLNKEFVSDSKNKYIITITDYSKNRELYYLPIIENSLTSYVLLHNTNNNKLFPKYRIDEEFINEITNTIELYYLNQYKGSTKNGLLILTKNDNLNLKDIINIWNKTIFTNDYSIHIEGPV